MEVLWAALLVSFNPGMITLLRSMGTDVHLSRGMVISPLVENSESTSLDETTPSQFTLLGQSAHVVWCKSPAGQIRLAAE